MGLRLAAVSLLTLVAANSGLIPAPAFITGVIRDPATRAPIAGAVVSVNGDLDSAITDASGAYRIRRPTRTEVSLAVKHPGYLTFAVPMVALGSDTLHFNVDLHSNPVKLMSSNAFPAPVVLTRKSVDTLIAQIGDSAMFANRTTAERGDIHSVEVIKRRTARVVSFGPAGQAGGVLLIVMKQAAGFEFRF
jgi:hypothetical protein